MKYCCLKTIERKKERERERKKNEIFDVLCGYQSLFDAIKFVLRHIYVRQFFLRMMNAGNLNNIYEKK
ncbi:hypothetical protein BpHYR1_006280 [Brachionus plicatilis]|uniref:Uncharacterized protein n=1 Tax=Brachionus plicatilis TaxID=10195 RepID=A0A3M7RBP2_BRAPC|nr:hypothetical protein BpHYR1_006280 [Brachionus plicatilis]